MNRSDLREKYGNEKVFVVLREQLNEKFDLPEGFSVPAQDVKPFLKQVGFFAYRWKVEYNKKVRQPIPFIVIKSGDKIFATTRLIGSGEERLHGKISLGIGGHINPEDQDGSRDMFYNAMIRELHEEVKLNSEIIDWKYVGIINDNSNEVSQDHLALVYVVEVEGEDVAVKEIDKLEGGFFTTDELLAKQGNLESWSQIILANIIQVYS